MKQAPGRMIRKEISRSRGFAELTPEAGVLFCMLIPHFSSWGKMNGEPGFIKGEICPRIDYLTIDNIPELMAEITEKTSVKWFEQDDLHYIHSINFLEEHQNLRKDRMGEDLLPSWDGVVPDKSGSSPRVVPPEVKGKVKSKGKEKLSKRNSDPPSAGSSQSVKLENTNNEDVLALKSLVVEVNKVFPVDVFNTAQFINTLAKKQNGTKHPPEVFIRVFTDLVEAKKVKDPWAFCLQRFGIHSQNVHEERCVLEAQELKDMDNHPDLKDLTDGIGEH